MYGKSVLGKCMEKGGMGKVYWENVWRRALLQKGANEEGASCQFVSESSVVDVESKRPKTSSTSQGDLAFSLTVAANSG